MRTFLPFAAGAKSRAMLTRHSLKGPYCVEKPLLIWSLAADSLSVAKRGICDAGTKERGARRIVLRVLDRRSCLAGSPAPVHRSLRGFIRYPRASGSVLQQYRTRQYQRESQKGSREWVRRVANPKDASVQTAPRACASNATAAANRRRRSFGSGFAHSLRLSFRRAWPAFSTSPKPNSRPSKQPWLLRWHPMR
jgi:hypothetical protein